MPIRAHGRLAIKSEDLLVLASNSRRRLVFLLLFLLLSVAMYFGFNPATDFAGKRLFATFGYMVVLLLMLGVSAFSKSIYFDRGAGEIRTLYTLLGLTVKRGETLPFAEIRRVVLQQAKLMKTGQIPVKRGGVMGGLLEPRSQLYRLFIDTGEKRIKLDESNYGEELQKEGTFISQFLGVPCTAEEI